MSTFMLKNTNINYTPVSNIFIEKYMPNARGKFIKVYLLLLKYNLTNEPGVTSEVIAASLSILESDVMNALHYWHDQGIIKLLPIDSMNNFNIEFLPLEESYSKPNKNINLVNSLLNNNETVGMVRDIEKILCRPLSTKEIETYLSWQKDYNFSSELILLLIEYCTSKGKNDYRYIEKVALSWTDKKITSIDQAQNLIKETEDKWINIRKILTYLGIKNTSEVMKPQEDLLNKWLYSYKFDVNLIQKACDICFERLNRADFKYIDGILSRWYKDNIKTLEDVDIKDRQNKPSYNKSKNNNNNLKFNNFEARSYDYDSLEKKLLGWDNDD